MGSTVGVKGFSGVACVVLGRVKVWEPCMCFVTDPETGEEYEEDTGEGEWVDGLGDRVRVRMVGDDHVYEADTEDCMPIDETEFCGCCGQIGCHWGASES